MKIAIILVGHIRTWEHTKHSFDQTFGKFSPDLFITTYDKKYGFAPYIRGLTNFHGEEDITSEQIRSMFLEFNVVDLTVDSAEDMDRHLNEIKDDIKIKYDNIASFYPQFLKLKREFDILKEHEEKNGFKYDAVIKTRCDLVYKDFKGSLHANSVIIDRGNVFPNDVIFMATRDNVEKIVNFLPEEFFAPKYESSGSWPPHSILNSAFRNANLIPEQLEIVDYVARMNLNQKY